MDWRHWFAPYPDLTHIQVEVTTACNAGCSYCPRTVAGKEWIDRHLAPEVLSPVLPLLRRIPYVHLQGWGEPLLNPRFFDIVAMVRQEGCRCGTTTNGALVDRAMADALVSSGIDVVAFSLTGAGPSHDRFRRGATLAGTLEGIHFLVEARNRYKKKKIAIHVAYMLLRDGVEEIERLPGLFGVDWVDEIVVSTLDHVPHPCLEGQVLQRGTPEWEEVVRRLYEAKKSLELKGTRLVYDAGGTREKCGGCTEDVGHALVVAADGGVHPCVFANLPDPETGGKRKCFGNLSDSGLDKIWWSHNYRSFRDSSDTWQPDELCRRCAKRGISV